MRRWRHRFSSRVPRRIDLATQASLELLPEMFELSATLLVLGLKR
jgi:hypothetical protein